MKYWRTGIRVWIVVGSTVGALVLMALIAWYGRQMSEAILPGMNSVRTADMEPVNLVLRDADVKKELRLRIPKAYLTDARTWRGGAQKTIILETRIPELKPAQSNAPPQGAPGTLEHASSMVEFNNGIYIHIDNNYGDWKGARRALLETYSINRNSKKNVAYELVSDDEFGLSSYKALACRQLDSAGVNSGGEGDWQCQERPREYYVSKKDDPAVQIFCDLTSATGIWRERQGCQARTSFNGFALTYIFRHSQMNRWQEFDSGVRQLLESFVVEEPHR